MAFDRACFLSRFLSFFPAVECYFIALFICATQRKTNNLFFCLSISISLNYDERRRIKFLSQTFLYSLFCVIRFLIKPRDRHRIYANAVFHLYIHVFSVVVCDFSVPRFLDQMLKFEEGKAARHNLVISYDNIMSCLRICSHLCENHEFYEK